MNRPDISVKDARRLRHIMESRIIGELDMFTAATGMFVKDINLTKREALDENAKTICAAYFVDVEVFI